MDEKTIKGWKFLSPDGCTYHDGVETAYLLPRPDQKWSDWFRHPDPAECDGMDCGPGRWHMMLKLSADYAPPDWYVWFAEGRGIVGQSYEKAGVTEIRLRRVPRAVWWRIIRLGWCRGASLDGAILDGANLTNASLSGASLNGANLDDASLDGASLDGASLDGATYCRHTRFPDGYAVPESAIFVED